jgi:glycosyltransferase involved in cell wall biosynthesis
MEALAAGVPLVARGLPVLREVFGGAARFADDAPGFAAALHRALTVPDPDRRRAGQSLAARHTWRRSATHHLALYRSLLTPPPLAAPALPTLTLAAPTFSAPIKE